MGSGKGWWAQVEGGNVLEKTSKCHEEWHCGGQQQLQLMKNTVRSKSLWHEDLQRRKLSGGVLR